MVLEGDGMLLYMPGSRMRVRLAIPESALYTVDQNLVHSGFSKAERTLRHNDHRLFGW
jgi:hypothetical protein